MTDTAKCTVVDIYWVPPPTKYHIPLLLSQKASGLLTMQISSSYPPATEMDLEIRQKEVFACGFGKRTRGAIRERKNDQASLRIGLSDKIPDTL